MFELFTTLVLISGPEEKDLLLISEKTIVSSQSIFRKLEGTVPNEKKITV